MHQIVYTSTAAEDFSFADIKQLLLGARRRNRSLGVSGMLVFHDRTFLQAIEGEIIIGRPVQAVFDFAADQRNESRCNQRMTHADEVSDGPVGRDGLPFRREVLETPQPRP